jgi:hypothetical protein
MGMNPVQLPKNPLRRPVRDPVCVLGRWLFVPDRMNAVGDVRVGYLSCNGERVVLLHCSDLLADLVRTIRQLEDAFAVHFSDHASDRTTASGGGEKGGQDGDRSPGAHEVTARAPVPEGRAPEAGCRQARPLVVTYTTAVNELKKLGCFAPGRRPANEP